MSASRVVLYGEATAAEAWDAESDARRKVVHPISAMGSEVENDQCQTHIQFDRLHFASTGTFHYIFPRLTMGLSLLIRVSYAVLAILFLFLVHRETEHGPSAA